MELMQVGVEERLRGFRSWIASADQQPSERLGQRKLLGEAHGRFIRVGGNHPGLLQGFLS
jgi:hypothetical protein